MASGGKLVVLAALGGNLAIAVTKFAAAVIAGSSSMLTEGIHSAVDTFNEVLLLYGRKRAAQPPDELHPLGHRVAYKDDAVAGLQRKRGGISARVRRPRERHES